MRRRDLFAGATIAAVVGCAAFACTSTTTGNEGNLKFSYVTDDNFADFNKPIAVGASLDINVTEAGDDPDPAEVIEASSDDPGVLEVSNVSGNTITVTGGSDGNILLSVDADVSGSTVSDSVNLTVRTPEVLQMNHTCRAASETEGYYLVDQAAWVPFELEMENGQPVIGYGYYPVDIDPQGGVELQTDHKGQAYMRFMTGSTAQDVTLTSQIDDSELTMKLATKGDVDGMELENASEVEAYKDENRVIPLRPTVGGVPVCQAKLNIEISNSTESVCDVSSIFESQSDEDDIEQIGLLSGSVDVRGEQVGDCTFTVTLPEADGGNGVSQEFTVPVIERPDEDNGDQS
jgi:hypothetical protein